MNKIRLIGILALLLAFLVASSSGTLAIHVPDEPPPIPVYSQVKVTIYTFPEVDRAEIVALLREVAFEADLSAFSDNKGMVRLRAPLEEMDSKLRELNKREGVDVVYIHPLSYEQVQAYKRSYERIKQLPYLTSNESAIRKALWETLNPYWNIHFKDMSWLGWLTSDSVVGRIVVYTLLVLFVAYLAHISMKPSKEKR